MMTKDEIQKTCVGTVYTIDEFDEIIQEGGIISNDGVGYFHDGVSDKDTDISVWSDISYEEAHKYPYVCWYNK